MAKISIALAACNGVAFLKTQLESLAGQTLLPAELVVSDDESSDGSVAEVERFAKHAPFPVRLFRNDKRLGVRKNFTRAIAACSGDIIALADQDDVWRSDKLDRLTAELAPPKIKAAFSDAEVVDELLTPLGYTMWQRVHFTRDEQVRMAHGDGFNLLLKHYIVTGATLAFKASLRDTALPIPASWPHDAWLAIMAAAQSGLVAVPEPLIRYRQHDGNVVGGVRKNFFAETRAALALDRAAWYRDELTQWHELSSRLGSNAPAMLAEKIAHLEARAELPLTRRRRLPGVLREIASGRYARHSRNWGSIAIDVLIK